MSIRLYTVSYSLYVFLGYTASKGFWTEWKDMPKNKNVKFLTKTKQKESALTQRNQFVLLRFGVLDDLGNFKIFSSVKRNFGSLLSMWVLMYGGLIYPYLSDQLTQENKVSLIPVMSWKIMTFDYSRWSK